MLIGIPSRSSSSVIDVGPDLLPNLSPRANHIINTLDLHVRQLAQRMVKWERWLSTKYNSEGSFGGSGMNRTVQSKLTLWQTQVPVPLVRANKAPQYLLNATVKPLALPICLRMIRCRHCYLTVKQRHETCPEQTGEPGISVGYYFLRHPKLANPLVKEEPRGSFSIN